MPHLLGEMEFASPNLNVAKLKRKVDISALTLQIAGENIFKKGRFYLLWRDGNFLVIQAEPWWRHGFVPNVKLPIDHYLEEHRALWHLQEVIQTMLDTIVFDGENNWAYLVRLKNKSYHLVYKKRQLIHNCPIWTKVVELDDIEVTRFASGLCWEGVYEGKDVDILIGWQDDWGAYVSAESRGQMLVQSRGVGDYFFDLEAHVSKNGDIVGIMMEALVGRCVTPADLYVVFEAVADIQRHGVFFSFEINDIYITKRGVRFASASSAKYYQDRDALAKDAESMWKTLEDTFSHMDENPVRGLLTGSRSMSSSAFIIPRLPSPSRPVTLTPEEARIRWIWSTATSDEFCRFQGCAFTKLQTQRPSSEESTTYCDKRMKCGGRALLPPDDLLGLLDGPGNSVARTGRAGVDGPLAKVSTRAATRHHPYTRFTPRQLLLPQDSD